MSSSEVSLALAFESMRDNFTGTMVKVKSFPSNQSFLLPFYSAPQGYRMDLKPLEPGDEVFIEEVVLAPGGRRIVGRVRIDRTILAAQLGAEDVSCWVNLRVFYNRHGGHGDTMYVERVQTSQDRVQRRQLQDGDDR